MAQAAQPRQGRRGLRGLLNSDGRAHPVENGFAGVTALLGVVAFVAALLTQAGTAELHLLASWAGLAGVLAGGWGQYISATTGERFVVIVGMGAAAFGLFLGMANGGLFGGLLG
ncbi:hypothetical protein [Streptomyces sp. JJ36]|uniref:hypothetical protein n=1 Tax=Streptomyces sp. JJ36 TaxID=2736645 RepID=UPI001F285F78|nr:hypothetical protein [Streptomyces sp. JJ36]MCF6522188.1 hypothetical protein [Streptomyces sp. JJ36]